jgi:regulator of sigma E protease
VQRESETVAINVLVDTAGKLGVGPANLGQYKDDIVTEEFGFIQSFPAGYEKGMGQLKVNVIAFGEMFKGKLDPVKSVSGPVGIAKIFGATWNWQRFWEITGMLSFILAFMNLLPIPALDGGHVIFLLIEMVRRKPLPEKVMYYFQIVGMIILFALMGFIIFIDTFNAIFN